MKSFQLIFRIKQSVTVEANPDSTTIINRQAFHIGRDQWMIGQNIVSQGLLFLVNSWSHSPIFVNIVIILHSVLQLPQCIFSASSVLIRISHQVNFILHAFPLHYLK